MKITISKWTTVACIQREFGSLFPGIKLEFYLCKHSQESLYPNNEKLKPEYIIASNTTVGTIDFYEYLGNKWGVLMPHPNDFTPVCTTEIGRTAQLQQEFDKKDLRILIASVDPLKGHHDWVKDLNDKI
jgi:peroxiredoxin